MKNKLITTIMITLFLTSILSMAIVTPATASDQPKIIDLGTLGGDSSSSLSINNRGQVAGDSKNALGDSHAFLWTK